jgi:ATP-dependent DNA helicase RecG
LDPVISEVEQVLGRLDRGEQVDAKAERLHLDLKEEPGRRDRSGAVGPSSPRSEHAAQALAGEAICMANTPGGGALIIGVADDGQLIGTDLDPEWLRNRIYEKSNRALTVDARAVFLGDGTRLVVLVSPQAIEPIRWNSKIYWRLSDRCQEVDPSTWHARRMSDQHFDWSAQESYVSAAVVRPAALETARRFLLNSGEPSAADLASASDAELLRRLNVVSGEGRLTNAGVLAFVGRDNPCLDYVHRLVAGGDSTVRVRRERRSLLEELSDIFEAFEVRNEVRHIRRGLVVGQVRELPALAVREAIVNGVAHREWGVSEPTIIEHIGRTVRVTSPGGFFGGVNEHNIITHPSKSRNRALTELLAALRVAEREGIGVDRMVRGMLAVGHAQPDIRQISGPYVRTALVGDSFDEPWIAWLSDLRPATERSDVNTLLILRRVVEKCWIDVTQAAPIVQLSVEEARGALRRVASCTIGGEPILAQTAGVPEELEIVWHLSSGASRALRLQDAEYNVSRSQPTRDSIAREYVRARGRMSTTELGDLVGASPTNVGDVLKGLVSEGLVEPSRPSGRGRGLFYRVIKNSRR